MTKSPDYLIERSYNPPRLRIFQIATGAGSLLLPECVADLTAIESAPSIMQLLDGMNLASEYSGNSRNTEGPTPASLETATEAVVDFLSSNISDPNTPATVQTEFKQHIMKKVREESPQAANALDTLIKSVNPSKDTPDLHTGFYL